eukprot:6883641-Pyramimonas_sp.AAC.1
MGCTGKAHAAKTRTQPLGPSVELPMGPRRAVLRGCRCQVGCAESGGGTACGQNANAATAALGGDPYGATKR